jgi:hypothetical protein
MPGGACEREKLCRKLRVLAYRELPAEGAPHLLGALHLLVAAQPTALTFERVLTA